MGSEKKPRGIPQPRIFLEIGQPFGEGKVTVPDLGIKPRKAQLLCSCGTLYSARIGNLANGNTKSCGHLKTGGLSHHPLRGTWYAMIYRCENPAVRGFESYGGRGIKVCPEWHDFLVFAADIDRLIGPRPPGMTLDRKNNDGHYEPGNVQWADDKQQGRNRRTVRSLTAELNRHRRLLAKALELLEKHGLMDEMEARS